MWNNYFKSCVQYYFNIPHELFTTNFSLRSIFNSLHAIARN